MDNIRPRTSSFSPSTRFSTTRTPHRPQRPKKIMKSIWVKKASTVGSQAVLPQNVSVKGSAMINPTQTWRPKGAYLDSVNRDNGSYTLKQFEYGNPEEDLKDYAIIDMVLRRVYMDTSGDCIKEEVRYGWSHDDSSKIQLVFFLAYKDETYMICFIDLTRSRVEEHTCGQEVPLSSEEQALHDELAPLPALNNQLFLAFALSWAVTAIRWMSKEHSYMGTSQKRLFQVTPKVSHMHAVKGSLDSDYAGDNHDRRSTSGGCQYLGRRLVSWQCKKQTIVAISSTEAEYVAAASCCAQRLINVVKVHTDDNVADLLTKGFDLARFNFLVVTIAVIWDSHRDIGYEGNLAQLTFSKPLFSPQWRYLVHVLLHCLSPKSTSWEQFGTNIASALVGLATNQKFQIFFDDYEWNARTIHLVDYTLTPPMLEVITALAAEEAHSTSPHSRAASSPRDAQDIPQSPMIITPTNDLKHLEEMRELLIYML
ncbi:hypothetical protein Tco_0674205 [Tanacetum coccineum]